MVAALYSKWCLHVFSGHTTAVCVFTTPRSVEEVPWHSRCFPMVCLIGVESLTILLDKFLVCSILPIPLPLCK